MAIVKMKKFKLFALEKDRKPLLKELQKFDYVHFVKTTNEENEDLKPRGLKFVEDLSSTLTIPIFAIGGIDEKNSQSVIDSGAFGLCMMSSLMKY